MKERFEAFLKEQGVYDEFISRAKDSLGEEELENMFVQDKPKDWVASAFVWGEGKDPGPDTVEDVDKWMRIDGLWETLCESSQ